MHDSRGPLAACSAVGWQTAAGFRQAARLWHGPDEQLAAVAAADEIQQVRGGGGRRIQFSPRTLRKINLILRLDGCIEGNRG
jgi:hypothetical protein